MTHSQDFGLHFQMITDAQELEPPQPLVTRARDGKTAPCEKLNALPPGRALKNGSTCRSRQCQNPVRGLRARKNLLMKFTRGQQAIACPEMLALLAIYFE